MKRFFASIITIILAGLFANSAQCADTCTFTQKNSIEVGGSFSLKSSAYFQKDILASNGQTQTYTPPPEYDLSFSPYIGWFPADNLELDFGFTFTAQNGTYSSGNYSSFQSSAYAGAAYYFNIDSLLFPYAGLLVIRYADGPYRGGDAKYGWQAGCKIAVTNTVLLNASAQMLYNSSEFDEFAINAGFSFIL